MFRLCLLITIWFTPGVTLSQTILTGSVKSIDGQTIPLIDIQVNRTSESDIFSKPEIILGDEGQYKIEFSEAGIYRVSIRAVFHQSTQFSLLVFDQQEMEGDVYLKPLSYKKGRYFDEPEYLEWIRVYGDFNDYDYFTGYSFRLMDDGSISATIPADRDTIRYQVRGLTNGPTVLPGAHTYHQRDNGSFEAMLIKKPGNSAFTIRYHPDEPLPYPSMENSAHEAISVGPRTFIMFDNPKDRYWIEPMQLQHVNYQQVAFINSFREIRGNKASENKKSDSLHFRRELDFRNIITRVENHLKKTDLHEQQYSAMLIAYISLHKQYSDWQNFLTHQFESQPTGLKEVDFEIFKTVLEKVPPSHPLWANNRGDLPNFYLDLMDYSPESIHYAEQMVQHHSDDLVVREVALEMIKREAKEHSTIQDINWYLWIVERYGERNLARLAKRVFEDHN